MTTLRDFRTAWHNAHQYFLHNWFKYRTVTSALTTEAIEKLAQEGPPSWYPDPSFPGHSGGGGPLSPFHNRTSARYLQFIKLLFTHGPETGDLMYNCLYEARGLVGALTSGPGTVAVAIYDVFQLAGDLGILWDEKSAIKSPYATVSSSSSSSSSSSTTLNHSLLRAYSHQSCIIGDGNNDDDNDDDEKDDSDSWWPSSWTSKNHTTLDTRTSQLSGLEPFPR
ncbi:hypothetical protein CTA2_9641 [Colletotrichum tanaceti]|uniref:Uncharacterized protein n=1 Tax=Colletotrichum tanaceti TaxID=1306861 RepID=A0A4V6DIE5_9PEZI|nr:hypothetical protein CTA2_9641 [Colletotrichum tanaceti]TKW59466.1 hypothetical protein CTA1_11488 [Colletotrichum tanaceti]